MTSGMKSTGKTGLDLLHATFEFIKLAAIVALEMVMVLLAGNLVAGRITGNLNRCQPAIFDQRFDVAINRGNSQTAMALLRGRQGFFQRERSISLSECPADRVLLSCMPDVHQSKPAQ